MDALQIFASRFTPPGDAPEGIGAVCLPSLTGAADAFLALSLAVRGGGSFVLAVTPGIPDAERLADDLRLLASRPQIAASAFPVRILELPPKLDGDRQALGVRMRTVAAVKSWCLNPYPCVVVAAFPALLSPVPADADPASLSISADEREKSPDFSDFVAKLTGFGYERLPQVEKEGDCSVRGGIVDFWTPGDEFPVRAEFFGDELESLRQFNPSTQTSIGLVRRCEIVPVRTSDAASGSASAAFCAILPPAATVLALEHVAYNLAEAASGVQLAVVYTGDPAPAGVPTRQFLTSPLPGFADLGAGQAHHPELFDDARKRLAQHLAAARRRGDAVFEIDELSGGFELPGLVVAAKSDRVFAKKKTPRRRAAGGGVRLNDFDDLEPGELVVHVDYGVGRYLGSSEILLDGRHSEVFTIEYADGAKLHVPAAHAHLLSRYVGVRGATVELHRLDGRRWAKDREAAQRSVTDLAAALLETQAKRDTVPGFAYNVECEGLEAFEAAFPYEETPDQAAAIAAVKRDLAASRPMDRLVCGDAGYGKTEVAMRAAFIAAMNGKQTAVLAPTTVLAEQHFETFTSRFDGTPVRIESCSRFQSAATQSGTFRRLASGACDIVIGTHAILSGKIAFRDLGLIVIDEEQRFGVRHKEFLKRLRATADVLTLSATPIPRTLYLSMTGARDLSLLRSPPRERVAVETRIVRDSDETVRQAIESELRRGGQVFFLHNRVNDIRKVEQRLREICPRVRIVTAHGQLDARELAKRMRKFESGGFDVLLSTTIIESGIDIPRANTILVDRADCFGMADLYQLRGRVGRSSRQGFAYFLLPPSGIVDAEARERLSALKRHGGLGGGFNLAVRDLELRGAGNLLGPQQSGHVAAVGFGLYCQLLQRTIAAMKGERVKAVVDVKLNLDFANPRLPYTYIEEDVQRLSLMKRFAEAQDLRAVKALAAEMKDRFGPPPDEAREFVHVAMLRVACAMREIARVDVKAERAVFYGNGSPGIAFVGSLRGKTGAAKLAELLRMTRSRPA